MFATIQLLLPLGLGGSALVADLVVTGAALATGAFVIARSRRVGPTATGTPTPEVAAEAEAVLSAAHRQSA